MNRSRKKPSERTTTVLGWCVLGVGLGQLVSLVFLLPVFPDDASVSTASRALRIFSADPAVLFIPATLTVLVGVGLLKLAEIFYDNTLRFLAVALATSFTLWFLVGLADGLGYLSRI